MVSRSWIYKFLTDIIVPNKCPVCAKAIKWDGLLCKNCEDKLAFADNAGISISAAEDSVALLIYKGEVKDMIYSLKHSGEANNFAEYCAEGLCRRLAVKGIDSRIDIVTAVPMNAGKKFLRGYNQAELIAEFAADILKKPADFRLLVRKGGGGEQHLLSPEERRRHAFDIYGEKKGHRDISGKRVLICDDVITTGSTMNVCAELLKKMGAKEVYCCSAATSEYNEKASDE